MTHPGVEFSSLLNRGLILVTGKGGVGKTSVSAALALKAAQMGMRPLVVTCDGKPTVGRLLGDRDEGPNATLVAPGVHALTVDFAEALADLIGDILGGRRLVEVFLANKVVRTFVHAAPSVLEMTILHRVDKARGTTEPGGPFSPVIVDLPASGHALALLSTPRAMMRMVRVGPLYRRAGELLRLFNDPKQTAMCVVTLPEELPINETIELVQRARGLGAPVGHIMVNAVPHAPLKPEDAKVLDKVRHEGTDPVRAWAHETLNSSARSMRAQAEIERLLGTATGPVLVIPFVTENGPALARRILDAMVTESPAESAPAR